MKIYTAHDISNEIKAEALRLGFSACGIAKAEPVDSRVADAYRQWLRDGKHASMQYLTNNLDKRLDPTLLMPGAKSIICLALNYYPNRLLAEEQYQFAYYAYGQDYHDVMKRKMQSLALFMKEQLLSAEMLEQVGVKLCCDTVPILDRYWASRAGIGWIGKNGSLIIPHAGSYFFLGEILVDVELDYDKPVGSRCGTCQKCIEACPTKALSASSSESDPHILDARKCLSYLTIEHRGDFPVACQSDIERAFSTYKTIYGCECCQKACPWNRFAQPTKIQEFVPSDKFLSMSPADWQNLTVESYRTLFKGSAVKRAKYEGLMRNITHHLPK